MLSRYEEYLLVGIMTLGDEGQAYGASLASWLRERSNGRFQSLGSIYTTLERLEKEGMVTSWHTEFDGAGRSRRYFRITGLGKMALNGIKTTTQSVWGEAWV